MARYLVALGSSHSNGSEYIDNALANISEKKFISPMSKSKIYKNNSSSTSYSSMFFNCVCAFDSPLQPQIFYRELGTIEINLGRIRTYKFARRTIDIDVIMSLDFAFAVSNFYLPHREAFKRMFFVIPAIEALQSAGWPIPVTLVKARAQFGQGYLCPLPHNAS